MKLLHKYGTRRNEIRRAKRELYVRAAMVMMVILFFAFMLVIGRFSPRATEDSLQSTSLDGGDPLSDPKLVRLREQVSSLMDSYHTRVEGRLPMEDDLKIVQEAIFLQEEIINSRSAEIAPLVDIERLEELKSMHDEEVGGFLMAQSLQLEKQGQDAWNAGEHQAAIKLVKRAQSLQAKINENYPRSSNRDPGRLHQLANLILTWQVKPQADRADQLRDEALTLVEADEFAAAKSRIREALEIQRALNRDFRRSRYATLARLKALEEVALKVEVAPNEKAVARLIAEAKSRLQSGDKEAALVSANEAEILQSQIISRFPSPSTEQKDTLAAIRILKETASSLSAYNKIMELQEQTRLALRQRDMETFQNLVPTWLRECQNFVRNFPNSERLGNLDLREVNFLHDRRDEIPSIMDRVYFKLKEVKNQPDVRIFSTEVSQALFESVSGFNPSSQLGPLNPVESVTWNEAYQFTRQLGWILGREVTLPNEDQFLDALGSVDARKVMEAVWASDNSGREIKPVGKLQPNAAGCHDLLGNVAEWIDPGVAGSPDTVVAIGGSARESRARMATIPRDFRQPDERNRYIGFRFVVSVED